MFDFKPNFSKNVSYTHTNIDHKFFLLSFLCQETFRKSFTFITVSDFWPTTLAELNSTMNVFWRSFTNLDGALSPIIP